ncbi:MAG: YggS family pyridoxal phosphate-dependent enzyme [Bdellovibrionota bacterium]|nr:YggS family pyridoxal phosphate-dependent enzyme [Bdellovibrionota bacterium]
MSVVDNFIEVQSEIMDFCKGKNLSMAKILVVSKKQSIEKIQSIIDSGYKTFAENYVQEWREKEDALRGQGVHWHFIGQLQTNKVKYLVGKVELIHTLDSEKLWVEIDKRAKSIGVVQEVLLQIDWEKREDRGGIAFDELESFFELQEKFPSTLVRGLMTVAPIEEEAKLCFQRTADMFAKLKEKNPSLSHFDQLSMGMSGDYLNAIESGANLVRIGSKIMGERQ